MAAKWLLLLLCIATATALVLQPIAGRGVIRQPSSLRLGGSLLPLRLGTSLSARRLSESTEYDDGPTSPPATKKSSSGSSSQHQCQYCTTSFDSRNALFRHLRSSADCYERATRGCKDEDNTNNLSQYHKSLQLPKQKLAVQFGYQVRSNGNDNDNDTTIGQQWNEIAAQLIQTAVLQAIRNSNRPVVQQEKEESENVVLTLSSSAKQRHPCLAQDVDCSAVSDVMCLNFMGEAIPNPNLLLEQSQQLLDDELLLLMANNQMQETNSQNYSTLQRIQILGLQRIPVSSRFHAEQGCTQRIYHYLLPLEWLHGGKEAQDWWLSQQQVIMENIQSTTNQQRQHQPRGSLERRPAVLAKLKRVLKSFESLTLESSTTLTDDHSTSPATTTKLASPGRFGSLWKKERRCWHNFADPTLGGSASPSNDPVWRALDQARILDFVSTPTSSTTSSNSTKVSVVIEFRGDSFVSQQVRRIMGSVVAMVNDWIPTTSNFVELATRPDVGSLLTPLAPEGRLYLANARFHFLELVHSGGNSLFPEDEEGNDRMTQWRTQLQSELLCQIETEQHLELSWLNHVRDVLTPQIRSQLDRISKQDETRKIQQQELQKVTTIQSSLPKYDITQRSEAPAPFQTTLSLLQHLVDAEQWPRTSRARSRVIRSVEAQPLSSFRRGSGAVAPTSSSFSGELFQSGSFTVVNKNLVRDETTKLPLGNELFPDLATALFELEKKLSELAPLPIAKGVKRTTVEEDNEGLHVVRPPSTHCAINRNAEFVPHVDSGKGQGQSVSMIVGLGDFSGGSIIVEGDSYNIRYSPLEFDGWKQRHWTEPFEGERFSLVWFTPSETTILKEAKDNDKKSNSDEESTEDLKARRLVQEHQKVSLPSYPLLKFRPRSTDALVINEIFDLEKGCAYELKGQVWGTSTESFSHKEDFSPRDHSCVLDIGAHIGVFSRFAVSVGCTKIIAYEPEMSNLELLRYNLNLPTSVNSMRSNGISVEIHPMAVAHGRPQTRRLVHARHRNDGTLNTWRHALEDYSQYVDKTTKLPSSQQEGTLTRSDVQTIPLFGGALVEDVTFVKLDCEGAEMDILLSEEAGMGESWRNVSHLVFEWSFTKEKRIECFHRAMDNLLTAGFRIFYEGQGSWWDTESNVMWPYHNDLVVYAMRGTKSP